MFDQDDVTRVSAHRRDIGMVFQDYALFPDKSAFDNVAYGLRARGVARAEITRRANEALDKVGLLALAQRYPAQMSGGQRQRAGARPGDPAARAADGRAAVQPGRQDAPADARCDPDLVREAGITTVFVTHDQEEALAMSDRIAIMDHGRIAQLGTPEELYGTPVNAYVADFIGSANVIPVPAQAVPGQARKAWCATSCAAATSTACRARAAWTRAAC